MSEYNAIHTGTKIRDRIISNSIINLGTLDDYINQYDAAINFEERYNEICEALYDLTGEQVFIKKNFVSVWGIPQDYEKYLGVNTFYYKVFATDNMVRTVIDKFINKTGINPESVPEIPIMEYVLVPTGNVKNYHPYPDKQQQGLARQREYQNERNWKTKIYAQQEQKYIQRKEAYDAEKRSEEDGGNGEGNDGERSEN